MRKWIPALTAVSVVLTGVALPQVAQATTPGLRGVIAVTGGGLRYLDPTTGREETALKEAVGRPAWNADGTRIAVQVKNEILVMNSDGSGRFPLRTCNASPSFDPDGHWVACSKRDNRLGTSSIFVVSLDGQVVTPLVDGGDYPEYSPDGEWITYVKDSQLHKIHPDGTSDTQVTQVGQTSVTGPMSWAPSGTSIVLAGANGDNPTQLLLIDPSSGAITDMPASRHLVEPSWAPDGKRLAAMQWSRSTGSSLITVRPDGTDLVTVATRVQHPAWQPASVTIRPSRTWVTSGQSVTFSLQMASPGTDRTLYLQRKLPHGDWRRVASDTADRNGDASVRVRVVFNAAYRVLWLGDDTHGRAWSVPTSVLASLGMTAHVKGEYRHRGKWNLFHAGDDIVFTVTLRPPKKDARVHFIANYKDGRFWRFAWQARYRTYSGGSTAGVRWTHLPQGSQGRIRAEWDGDDDNAPARTAFVYVRVTR